jgi:hypothetical protein
LQYGIAQDSPILSLYYAVRLRDLVRRYAGSVWALHTTGTDLSVAAARRARMASWISGG